MLSTLDSEAKSSYVTKIALFDGLKVLNLTFCLSNQNMRAGKAKTNNVKYSYP